MCVFYGYCIPYDIDIVVIEEVTVHTSNGIASAVNDETVSEQGCKRSCS